jgi:hypothetical protein
MTCLTCANWAPNKTAKEWTRLGYAKCALGPVWTVHGPADVCDRRQPCEPELAAKRQEWWAKRMAARAK